MNSTTELSNTWQAGVREAEKEPEEAFKYLPPDDDIKRRYQAIFALDRRLPDRPAKLIVDKVAASAALLAALPLISLLWLAYKIEGIVIPEDRGPVFFHYIAVSGGKTFCKYKFRLIKMKYVDKEAAARGDWHAYAKEWTPESRT